MSANWWADRLSGAKPVQPPTSTPPTYVPPQHVAHVPAAPYQPQVHQYQPPQAPQQYPQQQGHQHLVDPNQAPTAQVHVMEAVSRWQGGEAHRKEGGWHCPECGSQHYFSRSKGSISGKQPAPRCFECGYTGGLFTQAEQSNWAV